jgi:ComF family protein
MSHWRTVANALLSGLVAPPCAACAEILDHPLDGAVCGACWNAIRSLPRAPTPFTSTIARGSALGEYDGTLRLIVHALKYDGRRSVAPRLARLMAEQGSLLLTDADVVVPVPLHRRRQRERGFNQADDLARGLGLPIVRGLQRVRWTQPQVELPAAERQRNVQQAFSVYGSRWRETQTLSGLVVVLVDDVTTTGATLDACARVLREAGAREVRALTAARVATPLR